MDEEQTQVAAPSEEGQRRQYVAGQVQEIVMSLTRGLKAPLGSGEVNSKAAAIAGLFPGELREFVTQTAVKEITEVNNALLGRSAS